MSGDRKVVLFRVGEEEFAVDIHQVLSIERRQTIMPIPKESHDVLGVIDLRGKAVPVVDLQSLLFCGRKVEIGEETRIIIVPIQDQVVGFVVDSANEVLDITEEAIQRPNLWGGQHKSYIKGVVKMENRLFILLEFSELMSGSTMIDQKHLEDQKDQVLEV